MWKCLPFSWGIPIPVWISIAGAAIGFLGVYMAAHPPDKDEIGKKRFYKITFLILVALIVSMTWRQSSNDTKEKIQMFLVNSNQLERVQFEGSNQIAAV